MRVAIPPLPQYAFMAWCLFKQRDNFTFTFYMDYFTYIRFNNVASFLQLYHAFLVYSCAVFSSPHRSSFDHPSNTRLIEVPMNHEVSFNFLHSLFRVMIIQWQIFSTEHCH
jgi:hypothetical protein